MSCFFSGQDQTTLREEGNERNCFVSLIVNNAGNYCAAITRKVQAKKEVVTKFLDTSYEFFGEGTKYLGNHGTLEKQTFVDDAVIQYFMLDIEKEEVENPLSYLDDRFNEIEAKKAQTKRVFSPILKVDAPWETDNNIKDLSFNEWRNIKKEQQIEEPYLFDNKTMNDLTVLPDYNIDPTVIHDYIVKMILCSLIIDTTKIDIDKWITSHMKQKYDQIFVDAESFNSWAEFIVEFLLDSYLDYTTCDDIVSLQATIAQAMYDELFEFSGQNHYIDTYLEVLARYTEV